MDARSVTVARALDAARARSTRTTAALTLSALARRAGLPLATAHRLVGELHRWGALARRRAGEYVIGRRLWDLGLLAPVQAGLRQAASPFLHDLYGATLATVHLAVRDGTEVLYIDRLSGHVSVPVVSKIGSRLPMHATGVGKVLLAYAPDDVQSPRCWPTSPGSRRTRSPSPARLRRPAPPGPRRRLRHHRRGDEPGRLLGGGAGPRRPTARWSPRSASSCPTCGGSGPGWCRRCRWRRTASAARWPPLPCSGNRPLPRHPARARWLARMRTQVAIIGAGPAGLLLVPPARPRRRRRRWCSRPAPQEYVGVPHPGRHPRAAPASTCSTSVGLGDRLRAEGHEHRGIYLQWPGERHHLDFVDLTGRSVWVYGQTEVQKDLVRGRHRRQAVHYEVDRHRAARRRDRPAVRDVRRRRRASRSASTPT